MNTLAQISKKVSDGIFELKEEELTLSSLYRPTVVLCERDKIAQLKTSDIDERYL